MSHRRLGQLSFADGLVKESGGAKSLEQISASLKWEYFADKLFDVYSSARGRPSYPPLVLFKCLLLQQWYRLSDPGLEDALGDRLSFRRFVGLSLSEDVPDHSTLSRFRAILAKDNLAERLFNECMRQLSAQGLLLRQGTLIDATVVAADSRPLPREQAAQRSDQDAGFTMTRRGYVFGYKAHVAMDEGTRLIRRAVLTPANVHDSHWPVVRRLVQGDEGCVFGDKAYDAWHIHQQLEDRGIADGILKRRPANAPLQPEDFAENIQKGARRRPVESIFGHMKRVLGYARVRYRTLARNAVQLQLLCIALNLKRSLKLAPVEA